MTPELKAKELIEKFIPYTNPLRDVVSSSAEIKYWHAKACAIICVDEIINALNDIYTRETEIALAYYRSVKQIIQQQ